MHHHAQLPLHCRWGPLAGAKRADHAWAARTRVHIHDQTTLDGLHLPPILDQPFVPTGRLRLNFYQEVLLLCRSPSRTKRLRGRAVPLGNHWQEKMGADGLRVAVGAWKERPLPHGHSYQQLQMQSVPDPQD